MGHKVREAMPDFERAKEYAFTCLANELPATAHYHSVRHTRDDVVPAAARLAAAEGIEGDDLLCLLTAACYHDLGHVKQATDHEAHSAQVATEVLPQFGYTPTQIDLIRRLILATRWPPQPVTLLEKIIADADVDSLGRDDFLVTSEALRRELRAKGIEFGDEEWYIRQLEFLRSHRYHTQAAQALRGPGKQRNMVLIERLLAESQSPG